MKRISFVILLAVLVLTGCGQAADENYPFKEEYTRTAYTIVTDTVYGCQYIHGSGYVYPRMMKDGKQAGCK